MVCLPIAGIFQRCEVNRFSGEPWWLGAAFLAAIFGAFAVASLVAKIWHRFRESNGPIGATIYTAVTCWAVFFVLMVLSELVNLAAGSVWSAGA